MHQHVWIPERRLFLRQLGAGLIWGSALYSVPGLFAEQLLLPTPRLTEGPFYPDELPLDQDNDLIVIKDSTTPAVGEIAHLTGRVLTPNGTPVNDVLVEIWQCDGHGVYLHSADSSRRKSEQDRNFQGYGRFTTDREGRYRFRTIKPVPYPGRPAPHIHVKVSRGDKELLTSQIMIRGHEGNLRDGVFRQAGDLIDRELIQTDFKPVMESKIGELAANFDIVLGRTPDERQFGTDS